MLLHDQSSSIFQLTLPVWGATSKASTQDYQQTFQLTLPVWGATCTTHHKQADAGISTHAPRVGSDRENEI